MSVRSAGAIFPGAPFEPTTADPMTEGIGPGAYANRADRPDLTVGNVPKIVPLRAAPGFYLEPRDPDPRGMPVIGMDGVVAGVVAEVWVDRSEPQLRYLEVELAGDARRVLLPIMYARINEKAGHIKVKAVKAHQFAGVPAIKDPDTVTLLEEDKIMAYFAGGYLFADPSRQDPLF